MKGPFDFLRKRCRLRRGVASDAASAPESSTMATNTNATSSTSPSSSFWRRIFRLGQAKKERERLHEELAALKTQLAQAKIDDLEKTKLSQGINALHVKSGDLQTLNDLLSQENTKSKAIFAEHEKQFLAQTLHDAAENTKLSQEVDALHSKKVELQHANESLSAQNAKSIEIYSEHESAIQALNSTNRQLEVSHGAAVTENRSLQVMLADASKNAETLEANNKALTRKNEDLRFNMRKLDSEISAVKQHDRDLESAVSRLQLSSRDSAFETNKLMRQNSELKSQVSNMQATITNLLQERNKLQDKNDQLMTTSHSEITKLKNGTDIAMEKNAKLVCRVSALEQDLANAKFQEIKAREATLANRQTIQCLRADLKNIAKLIATQGWEQNPQNHICVTNEGMQLETFILEMAPVVSQYLGDGQQLRQDLFDTTSARLNDAHEHSMVLAHLENKIESLEHERGALSDISFELGQQRMQLQMDNAALQDDVDVLTKWCDTLRAHLHLANYALQNKDDEFARARDTHTETHAAHYGFLGESTVSTNTNGPIVVDEIADNYDQTATSPKFSETSHESTSDCEVSSRRASSSISSLNLSNGPTGASLQSDCDPSTTAPHPPKKTEQKRSRFFDNGKLIQSNDGSSSKGENPELTLKASEPGQDVIFRFGASYATSTFNFALAESERKILTQNTNDATTCHAEGNQPSSDYDMFRANPMPSSLHVSGTDSSMPCQNEADQSSSALAPGGAVLTEMINTETTMENEADQSSSQGDLSSITEIEKSEGTNSRPAKKDKKGKGKLTSKQKAVQNWSKGKGKGRK